MRILFLKVYDLRYSDLDSNANVKLSAILDILQDVSIEHAASLGHTVQWQMETGIAWLLQGWRIRIEAPLVHGPSVVAKTGVMRVHQFEARRKYELWQNNRLCVTATASWFTVNTKTMKIIIVPPGVLSAYDCIDEPDNGLPFEKLRPSGESLPFVCEMMVEKRDIDTNHHMNNMKSVEIASALFPDALDIKELQVTYRKGLGLGDRIRLCGKTEKDGYLAELCNEKDEVCVLVRAKYTKNEKII